MDSIVRTDLAARFAPVIAGREGPFLAGDTLDALTLHKAGDLSVAWAPFEHVPPAACLVIVGIMPGRQQAENALRAFRDALARGLSHVDALRAAKLTGAFSGPMRDNLVSMLDHIGVPRALGLGSAAELFDARHELAHLTSALRYPVFVAGGNYNGTPDPLRTPALRRMIETCLAAEAKALPRALWLPLGPKPTAALAHLTTLGVIERARILEGLPHPSGANNERISYFLGRKMRATLSGKTRPEFLDEARERLTSQVSDLSAAL